MRLRWMVLCWWASVAPLFGQDMPLSQVLIPGENWETAVDLSAKLGETSQASLSITADSKGNLYFTQPFLKRIQRIDAKSGEVTTWWSFDRKVWEVKAGPDDSVYAQLGEDEMPYDERMHSIVARSKDGIVSTIFKDEDPQSASHFTVAPDSSVYYFRPSSREIYRIQAGEEPRAMAHTILTRPVLCFSPDGGTLVASDAERWWLWAFRVKEAGRLDREELFYGPLQLRSMSTVNAPQDLFFDTLGRLYVVTTLGIQVFDPIGRHCGTMARPRGLATGACFGGPQKSTLFAATSRAIYTRKLNATGITYEKR